ncbi:hypothetical protein P261_00266 [Lachnospiraceae bacterium TWA4]|nr:hypothetical protein P261_00266 [Lachnospiraceae bacterium TWA4]
MEKKSIFSTIEENVISVGIVIMFIMETINVIFKFALPDFAGVPAEIAIFAYIWVCFLCMGFCTKKSANIIVDALTMHYPNKLKKLFKWISIYP